MRSDGTLFKVELLLLPHEMFRWNIPGDDGTCKVTMEHARNDGTYKVTTEHTGDDGTYKVTTEHTR